MISLWAINQLNCGQLCDFTFFTNFLNLARIREERFVLGLVDILAFKFDSLYWKHILGGSFTTETKLLINVIVNWCSLMHDCVVWTGASLDTVSRYCRRHSLSRGYWIFLFIHI